jgi:hypothetical protein
MSERLEGGGDWDQISRCLARLLSTHLTSAEHLLMHHRKEKPWRHQRLQLLALLLVLSRCCFAPFLVGVSRMNTPPKIPHSVCSSQALDADRV